MLFTELIYLYMSQQSINFIFSNLIYETYTFGKLILLMSWGVSLQSPVSIYKRNIIQLRFPSVQIYLKQCFRLPFLYFMIIFHVPAVNTVICKCCLMVVFAEEMVWLIRSVVKLESCNQGWKSLSSPWNVRSCLDYYWWLLRGECFKKVP